MVTRKWLRAGLIALVLYSFAGAVIGYFGLNAYSGHRGLRAQQELDEQIAQLNDELAGLRAERATVLQLPAQPKAADAAQSPTQAEIPSSPADRQRQAG